MYRYNVKAPLKMFLPNGKDQNNTSSATKGDTFPSSYAGEGKKWGDRWPPQ
jgi:hypothetical protein